MDATQTLHVLPFTEGAEDAHGNPVRTWGAPVPWLVYGYGPTSSTEPYAAGINRLTEDVTVYAPTAPDRRDRVVVGGLTYEVAGVPGDWNHGPFGYRPGFEVQLRRVDG